MVQYELGVIGAGNMAEAILRGIVGSGFLPAEAIVAADPQAERRRHVEEQLSLTCVEDNLIAAGCGRILLAVKPRMMGDVLAQIAPAVAPDTLVVSIAAGVRTAFLDAGLGGRGRIVRVMPNTPLLVGEGMSAVAAGPRTSQADVEWTKELFSAAGRVAVVSEDMLDAVTAVSGSGPAYFFYLVEAMTAAGVAEGLEEELALSLATQTCIGAGRLMTETGESPAELRRRVTSPGGTTQRAIETLEAAGVGENLIAAVRAAAKRSRELAD